MVCEKKDISHKDAVKDTNPLALHGIIGKVAKSRKKEAEDEEVPIKRGRGLLLYIRHEPKGSQNIAFLNFLWNIL